MDRIFENLNGSVASVKVFAGITKGQTPIEDIEMKPMLQVRNICKKLTIRKFNET